MDKPSARPYFGIVVVSADGRPIGYGRAFARLLTLPYAILPAGLGLSCGQHFLQPSGPGTIILARRASSYPYSPCVYRRRLIRRRLLPPPVNVPCDTPTTNAG